MHIICIYIYRSSREIVVGKQGHGQRGQWQNTLLLPVLCCDVPLLLCYFTTLLLLEIVVGKQDHAQRLQWQHYVQYREFVYDFTIYAYVYVLTYVFTGDSGGHAGPCAKKAEVALCI